MKRFSLSLLSVLVLGLPALVSAQFKYWNPSDTSQKPPALMSQTGLYTNITAKPKTMLAAAVPFEVNSALWSDGSHKQRWVMVKPGKKIGFKEKDDYWDYPDSTVFIKNFSIDTIPGDTTSRVLWETRFLINRKEPYDTSARPVLYVDYWYGYSYHWDADQKDAKLVDVMGEKTAIRWYPEGKDKPSAMKKWVFPSRDQCIMCHKTEYADTVHGRSVLGFFTAQLNRPSPTNPSVNQLEEFFTTKGILSGTKPASWSATSVPKWYGIKDAGGTVDQKARAYIAANCSGCHGHRGMETGATFGVDFNYDYFTNEAKMDVRHKSIGWAYGMDTIPPFFYPKNDAIQNPYKQDSLVIEPALVVPGYPEKSAILLRQISRNTKFTGTPEDYDQHRNQMPPLATFEVNEDAAAIIRQWILEMPKVAAPNATSIGAYNARSPLLSPHIQGRFLILPQGMASGTGMRVAMTGINGRTVELSRIGNGVYAIPYAMAKGVYVVKVGSRNFTRYLF